MTRLYRLKAGGGFAMGDPPTGPDYNRTYAEDHQFVRTLPENFELVPGQVQDEHVVIPRRGPGRPAWGAQLFRQRWRQAIARGRLPAGATYAQIAESFEALDGVVGEIDPEYLAKLARKHGTE